MRDHDVPCRFSLGDIVKHLQMGFRGVIVEIDDQFRGDERAYRDLPGVKPSREQPWYHVLVDGEENVTYLPEHALELDGSGVPIMHPMIAQVFHNFENGRYSRLLH